MAEILTRPDRAGKWLFRRRLTSVVSCWVSVTVTETPAAGRLCLATRMGCSAQCGLSDWSGEWRKL